MSGEADRGDDPAPGDGPARDERPAQSGSAAPDEAPALDGAPAPDEAPALDGVIHHPTRLTLVAFLSACDEAEFAAVRDGCRVSDSVLSKNASALEAAGYLRVRKGHVGKRPRTWLSLTPAGRQALARHLAALQDLVDAARGAAGSVGA
ncbi:transcriptional regulator [Streptomyces anulatus]|uniref:winged helix-turn-helix domain-containing protein n=1 Tax=Streptomyces anulatus TaxID=1892 RepID=UPI0006A13183|nr:transcriptional regulator [Streptomyces anulatus]KND35212.1 MarR family transcriptional regulator [Streptomyces europaeiscabiei]